MRDDLSKCPDQRLADAVRELRRRVARLEDVAEAAESGQEVEEQSDGFGGLPPRLVRVLVAAGFETPRAVRVATDDQLLAIDGVGRRTLQMIREALR